MLVMFPTAQSRPRSCLQASPNSTKKSAPPRWGSSITSCRVRFGPKVGLTDRVQCPLGSRDHSSGRYEPYPPDQAIDLYQVRDIVLLVTQRVTVAARGLVNEFNIERLPLGFDCFALRETKLRPLGEPRAPKRRQSADRGSSQSRQRWDKAGIHVALR